MLHDRWIQRRETGQERTDPEEVRFSACRCTPEASSGRSVGHDSEKLDEDVRQERIASIGCKPCGYDHRTTDEAKPLYGIEGQFLDRPISYASDEDGDEDDKDVDGS